MATEVVVVVVGWVEWGGVGWGGVERRVVVVVVLTVCIDDVSVHATKRHAPDSGGAYHRGHDPLGPAPVLERIPSW